MRTAGASHSRRRILIRMVAPAALLVAIAPIRFARAQSDPVTASDAERLGVFDELDGISPAAPPAAAAPVPAAPTLSALPPGPDSTGTAPIAESSPSTMTPMKAAEPAVAPARVSAAADSLPPARPVIITPSVPAISPDSVEVNLSESQGMEEIPQATRSPGAASLSAGSNDSDVARYQQQGTEDPLGGTGIGSLRDFVSEGEESSPIGVDLREARRKLKGGGQADGLLVMNVVRDSPAARAGLKPYHRIAQNMLTGATIAAAMVFPPAILILPVLDYTQVGESYDLIIGVDGARVTNFIDFEERMRNVQPGQLVYLSVVRNGRRIQVAISMPPNLQMQPY